MSTGKTIAIVIGTIFALAIVLALFVVLLIYLPSEGNAPEKDPSFACPEEQFTVMCVVRGYLVPSVDRS